MANVDAIKQRLDVLSRKVYSEEIKQEALSIIQSLAGVESSEANAAKKAASLVLRARARLLLPAYDKDAEADLAKALKLRAADTEAWIAMSECLWKREALKEARDALESALASDPEHVGALCQLSRIVRAQCGKLSGSANAAEEQTALLNTAVEKARAALRVDPTSAEAWACLGVALMQQTVAMGMDLSILRKASQALTQAGKGAEPHPDIVYNRGVARKCLGEYGAALADFKLAYELDPKGLAGAKREVQQVTTMLNGFAGVVNTYRGDQVRSRDLKAKVLNKLPLADAATKREFQPLRAVLARGSQGPVWSCVRVIELISSPNEQPLCYMAVDRDATFCAVLVYRTSPKALKGGDVLFIPFPPAAISSQAHTLPETEIEGKTIAAASIEVVSVIVEPTVVFVNGAPIAKSLILNPQLATRQFV
jgi:tetratricopeptide (TPR) repeat protein